VDKREEYSLITVQEEKERQRLRKGKTGEGFGIDQET
jgi:hypothetical protein